MQIIFFIQINYMIFNDFEWRLSGVFDAIKNK